MRVTFGEVGTLHGPEPENWPGRDQVLHLRTHGPEFPGIDTFISQPERVPAVLFEDEDLLILNKPPGLNTHSPSPWAGEGLYEWLRDRHPRWQNLGIQHRLDKETSGVIAFALSARANQSLARQFSAGEVEKRYLLQTDRPVPRSDLLVESMLVRAGDRYLSRPNHAGGCLARTRFRVLSKDTQRTVLEAEPLTGRTHQIRVHAAAEGFPILGDRLYGGSPAARLHLHSASLAFSHPGTGEPVRFSAPPAFSADPGVQLRCSLIDSEATTACRLIHGASDGYPGLYADRFGDFLLARSEKLLGRPESEAVGRLVADHSLAGVYHKVLQKDPGHAAREESAVRHLEGQASSENFLVHENGVRFEISFGEGYSVGLFLDQRDNRHRFLTNHVTEGFQTWMREPTTCTLLNTFAYTCGFSVCAALAGARVTSVDLSNRYLAWGKRNFGHNQLDPADHEFVAGDVFDWLRRWGRKRRQFDVVVLDPPTFSRSRASGVFRAEKDYAELVRDAVALVGPNGLLLCSCNAARVSPAEWVDKVTGAIVSSGRSITRQHYVPQPVDFPVCREEPAYLKTLWLRLH